MKGQSLRSNATPAPSAAEATAETAAVTPQASADKAKTFNHSMVSESERVVEAFAFPGIETVNEGMTNPLEPLALKSITWTASDAATQTMIVAAGGAVSDAKSKTAPLKTVNQHVNKVNIVAVIDSSESFNGQMKVRAKQALNAVAAQLIADGHEFYFALCGLEGAVNSIEFRGIDRTNQSLADIENLIAAAADDIFSKTGSNDEKVFRSAKLCSGKIPSAQRTPARATGFLLITDAPNCKTNSNADSSECNRTSANSADHHLHLWNSSGGLGNNKHLSALAVMYRRSVTALCREDDSDRIEVPSSGETLEQNSQYAESVKNAFSVDYPAGAGAITTFGALLGDMCTDTFDTAPATELAKVVTDIRRHRVPLSQGYDIFASAPYKLVATIDGTSTTYDVRGSVGGNSAGDILVSTTAGSAANPVIVTHHKFNNYATTAFSLSGMPEPGSIVEIWWDGAKQIECPAGASFGAGEPRCRWAAQTLYLANIDVLPATAPATAGVPTTKAFDLKYTTAAAKTTTVSFTATDILAANSVNLTSWPVAAENRVSLLTKTFGADNRSATLQLGADFLPTGTYAVAFKTRPERSYAHNLTLSPGSSVVCLKDSAMARISGGVISVEPADAIISCALSANRSSVVYRGPGAEAVNFKAAFKTEIRPLASYTLNKTPDVDGVTIKTFGVNGLARANSAFTMNGREVIFGTELAPGEKFDVSYTRTPPAPDSTFALASSASDGIYDVSMSQPNGVAEGLTPGTDYEIAISTVGKVSIKILRDIVPGAQLTVKYLSMSNQVETSTEN